MSCPANPKKFWIFNYEGLCDYKKTHIKPTMEKGEFHVTIECKACKHEHVNHFVDSRVLIRQGFDADKLANMSFFDSFGKPPEELKKDES